MMSFEPTIYRLSIEAFRGFRDVHEFDLSAAAVVITGPNGTGKTSFFDALQWGLLGRLERLESLRARRNVEHVVNQYRLGRKAAVEIDLGSPSGPVTVRRTGDQGGSTLELRRPGQTSLFGDEAELELSRILLPTSNMTLESALTTFGLMQQDVMRRVLEAKPAERYRQLSTILGLGALEDFEEAARAVAKLASERETLSEAAHGRLADAMKLARDRLELAQNRLASRPQVEAVREEAFGVLADAPQGVSLIRDNVTLESPNEVRLIATEFGHAANMIESAREWSMHALRLRTSLGEEPTEEELRGLQVAAARADSERVAAEHALAAAEKQLYIARKAAAEVAQLAALALPMLSDNCPVCGQNIDRAHVERQLRETAEDTGAILESQLSLNARAAEHSQATAAAAALREAIASTEERTARWREIRETERAAEAAIGSLAEDVKVVQFDRYESEALVDAWSPVLEYFRRARSALHELLETFDRQSEQGAVDRAAAEIRSLETKLSSAQEQLKAETARSKSLQSLAKQTIKARIDVTEARLRSIQPLVANIYQRLDPHPAFKTVEFELDTYYRRGTSSPLVIDEIENVSADPLLVFSSSQANIVALSYFIAMSLYAEGRGLPFLLLDDPVQSMDDVNVLGFADLCRHLRLRRQLIVSTHERRFASLLERKLAPRADESRTKIIRFTGWDRSGPTVNEYFVEAQLLEDPIRLVNRAG